MVSKIQVGGLKFPTPPSPRYVNTHTVIYGDACAFLFSRENGGIFIVWSQEGFVIICQMNVNCLPEIEGISFSEMGGGGGVQVMGNKHRYSLSLWGGGEAKISVEWGYHVENDVSNECILELVLAHGLRHLQVGRNTVIRAFWKKAAIGHVLPNIQSCNSKFEISLSSNFIKIESIGLDNFLKQQKWCKLIFSCISLPWKLCGKEGCPQITIQLIFNLYTIPGGPIKRNSRYSRFSGLCSDQQLSFSPCWIGASFPHYNNTKIIKFGWEHFILWVISYGLSFSGFADFQSSEARLMTNKWQIPKWQSIRN